MTAPELFHKVLADNNLTADLAPLRIITLNSGGVLIDQPQLVVSYLKEVPSEPTTPDPPPRTDAVTPQGEETDGSQQQA